MTKILITGLFKPTYPRNVQIIKAVGKIGATTIWPLKGRFIGGIQLFSYLLFSRKFDYVIIIQPIHFLLPWLYGLRFIPWRPKIVLDAFISIYDTNILDRKLRSPNSWRAKFYRWLDYLTGIVGEGVFFDTVEHQTYFNLPSTLPQTVVPVIPDYDLLDSVATDVNQLEPEKTNVLFYGSYIPLQGVEVIIEAIKILSPDSKLHFTLVGSGQEFKKIKNISDQYHLSNVTFIPRLPYEKIIAKLKAADLALGVFGLGDKMQRVIPNKVIEALATATPLITGASPAVERFFTHQEHLFLVPPGDPQALAEAIKIVSADLTQAKDMARRGRDQVLKYFNQEVALEQLSELLSRL